MTKDSHLPEEPWCGPLWGRVAGTGGELDPELSGKVVGEDADEYVRLVSDPGPDRYVIRLAMCPELGEDTLLRSPTFVEGNDLTRAYSLVGDDDLEFVPVFHGSEQVELDRRLTCFLMKMKRSSGFHDFGFQRVSK